MATWRLLLPSWVVSGASITIAIDENEIAYIQITWILVFQSSVEQRVYACAWAWLCK